VSSKVFRSAPLFNKSKHDYDDTPPVDDEGNIIRFYNKSSDSNSKLHKKQAENRKKIKLIMELKRYASTLNFKKKTELYVEL